MQLRKTSVGPRERQEEEEKGEEKQRKLIGARHGRTRNKRKTATPRRKNTKDQTAQNLPYTSNRHDSQPQTERQTQTHTSSDILQSFSLAINFRRLPGDIKRAGAHGKGRPVFMVPIP